MLQEDQILHDRFQLKQKLSQNAGRQTWLAHDLKAEPSELLVIVKLLGLLDQANDQTQWTLLDLFEREAKTLQQLDHPQIPKYCDSFSTDDQVFWFGLVQQYIAGDSLKTLLDQGKRFSEAGIRKITQDVLQILIYLHELSPPVLHRDIKPSNLILGDDNLVYLVDFGAVQDRAATEGATFTVVGTYGYAPMEQFGGRAIPSSDLYSLGATLVHLMTGASPADLPQKDFRIQFADRVSTAPDFVRWLEVLIEPNIERRFRTARQALEALQTGELIKTNAEPETPNSSTINASETTKKATRPNGTNVIVTKSADELLIQIPVWLWLSPLIKRFHFVYFNHDRFVVRKDPSRTFNRPSAITMPYLPKVSDIDDVFQDLTVKNERSFREVKLQIGVSEYTFGAGLSRAECVWLVQEIKDWLEI